MYDNKKMFILGMARSGYEVAKVLAKHNCDIVITDMKEQDNDKVKELKEIGINLIITDKPEDLLDDSFNYVVKNPGIKLDHPVCLKANSLNIPIINELEVAYHYLPKNVKIVGITGSNGKTTTTTLTYNILKEALYEFPVVEVKVDMPDWIACLNHNHWLKQIYIEKIKESVIEVDKVKDIEHITSHFNDCEYISKSYLSNVDTSTGEITVTLQAPNNLYNQVLKEIIGVDVGNKADLLTLFQSYNEAKLEYDQIKTALKMVKTTGYGVASPTLADMKLETPEIIKQGSRYGIKLKAVAPSIHMIRVDVESTFEPIIGSELQSKELINYLMKDYDVDPSNIWKSEIFGRSLDVIVKEGIQAKLSLTPENARYKLQQTLTKLVNKGSGNLFTIVL